MSNQKANNIEVLLAVLNSTLNQLDNYGIDACDDGDDSTIATGDQAT